MATRRPAKKRAAKKKAAPAKAPAGKKKPVWKEVEEREARKVSNRVRSRTPTGRRYAVVYDVDGPRVRLGLGWFVLEVAALALGLPAVAVLFTVVAVLAATQTSQVWRKTGQHPDRRVAAAGAAAVGFSGALSNTWLGAAILVYVGVALVAGSGSATRRKGGSAIVDASFTLRCGLFAGLAVAGLTASGRLDYGSMVALILVAGAYETGDYLVGSGASNPYEGPVAGATAILVVAFAVGALDVGSLAFPNAFVFAGLAMVLCPIGQLLASAILPTAAAPASALRRLDSLLVLAPAWAIATAIAH